MPRAQTVPPAYAACPSILTRRQGEARGDSGSVQEEVRNEAATLLGKTPALAL